MKVSVYEAKSKLSEMINRALAGEEVIITRNGKDAAKLTTARVSLDWIGMWEGQGEIKEDFFVQYDLSEAK